jgi:hypothetical protein
MAGPLLSSLSLGTFQDNLLSCEADLQNGAKNIIIQNGQGHHLWGKCYSDALPNTYWQHFYAIFLVKLV